MNRLFNVTVTVTVTVTVLFLAFACTTAQVEITSPLEGSRVQGPVLVGIALTGDPDKLQSVELSANDEPIGVLGRDVLFDDALVFEWTTQSRGPVELEARAYDLLGAEVARDRVSFTLSVEPLGGHAGSEGEGEGEGENVGEGEGEGEGEPVIPDGWVSPDAHPFARVTDFPSNASGAASAPNPGNLSMFMHVPAGLLPDAPIVVALHGCTQDATQYKTTTAWTDLADREKFIVVFPEQTVTADHNAAKVGNPMRCFNFAGYYGEKMARGEGENQSIKDMIDYVAARYSTGEVFATGLSAGGAMVPLLLATWPDVFAGGAPMAGIPYACANEVNGAIACMNGDASRFQSAATWGDRVRAAGPAGYAGPYPRVQVWHGDADFTVRYGNANEIVEQWTNVHGLDVTADITTAYKDDGSHTRAAHTNAGGDVMVELVTLPGMGHGIALDRGTGVDQGGGAGGFAFDVGIHSTYYAAKFFGIVSGNAPSPGEGEGEGEGEGPVDGTCEEVTSTIVLHQYALPARVRNTGTITSPVYEVIGSGEVIDAAVNPYLDNVTVHSTSEGFALGPCG